MDNKTLVTQLLKDLHPRSFTQQIKKEYPALYEAILNDTKEVLRFTKGMSFKDRVFHFVNPDYINNPPVCPTCNTVVTSLTKCGLWSEHCSSKCKGSGNSLISRDKARSTSMENWGVDNPAKHPTIKQKMKTTLFSNHGVEHALQSTECQAKKTQTMLTLYGVEHAAQSSEIQTKMVETYLENWGVTNPATRHITQDTIDKLNDPEWLTEQNKTLSFSPLSEMLGISTATLSNAFRKFGILPVRHNILVSEAEKEIVRYIQSLMPDIKIITSDLTLLNPYEVDIYLPEFNLAFEYNGLWYHREEFGKDHRYHITKTVKCAKKNVKLIHIWENDYITNPDIIYSKIRHFLGKSDALYARKCQIRELSIKDARRFLSTTHIQGYCSSTIKIGLILNDEIVACMTLGPTRFTDSAEWELLRYSTKLHHNVVGGFSKLLKYFIRSYSPASIISYSDKCWSTGEVYKTNGFEFLRTSKPSYFYSCDGKTVVNRMSCQKKKLKSKLAIYDPELTEKENMRNNGYYKIWNCGNDAWIWTPTTKQ